MSESQFNYLFTLKNAHLSSNRYNFWMQPSIAMKFAEYVAWILLCRRCKFGEKNLLQFQRYQIFPRGLLFSGAPCMCVGWFCWNSTCVINWSRCSRYISALQTSLLMLCLFITASLACCFPNASVLIVVGICLLSHTLFQLSVLCSMYQLLVHFRPQRCTTKVIS